MKFGDYPLTQELKSALHKLNLKRPTDIQYKAIPHILRKEDVLAIAQTGTGKTLAFLIPIVDYLLRSRSGNKHNQVYCLIMVPTHELAIQIHQIANALIKGTPINALAIYGGSEFPDIDPNRIPQILIATPGRLFDLNHLAIVDLSHTEILVLDEADRMLDMGFLEDIQQINRLIPKKRQTLFFSATISKTLKKLTYKIGSDTIRIQISPKDPVTKNVTHSVARIKMEDKRYFLQNLIELNPENKILVFTRTKIRVERVAKFLTKNGIDTITMHGDKSQKERDNAIMQFDHGAINVMITTDVSARGLDFKNVSTIVNYDLPENPENYVHRVGRSGRGKNKGQAISFCSNEETELLKKIEDFIKYPILEAQISKSSYKQILKLSQSYSEDINNMMKEIEEIEEIKRKKNKYKA